MSGYGRVPKCHFKGSLPKTIDKVKVSKYKLSQTDTRPTGDLKHCPEQSVYHTYRSIVQSSKEKHKMRVGTKSVAPTWSLIRSNIASRRHARIDCRPSHLSGTGIVSFRRWHADSCSSPLLTHSRLTFPGSTGCDRVPILLRRGVAGVCCGTCLSKFILEQPRHLVVSFVPGHSALAIAASRRTSHGRSVAILVFWSGQGALEHVGIDVPNCDPLRFIEAAQISILINRLASYSRLVPRRTTKYKGLTCVWRIADLKTNVDGSVVMP